MQVTSSLPAAKELVRTWKSSGETVGLVPTMGFLHQGHLSLVQSSKQKTDRTLVSVFVNSTQFAPHEDFSDYPRDLERDLKLLKKENVDVVFTPSQELMYPPGYSTYVEVHELQNKLCGRSRPIFFRGVCTVVLKLFHMLDPDMAFFGQKDAQQSVIIHRMVQDLNLDVKIEVCPIVRDKDGLALSSRNSYFNAEQRRAALCLSRSLQMARSLIDLGQKDAVQLIKAIRTEIQSESRARINYVEIVDPTDLLPRAVIRKGDLIALAVFIDDVRLIDNLIV